MKGDSTGLEVTLEISSRELITLEDSIIVKDYGKN